MDRLAFAQKLIHNRTPSSPAMLRDGARVAVIGGGPAGSFFSYFLLDMAGRTGLELHVDIYEPRDFGIPGPAGCNMCGGVIYESLVQSLAVDGINLPETVVQRGIEFNMLHLDMGSVRIRTSRREKRIATTFRGIGPRGLMNFNRLSLDGYLLKLAVEKGAHHIRGRVQDVIRPDDPEAADPANRPMQVKTSGGDFQSYDLVVVATGVNTSLLKLFQEMDFGYKPPRTAKLLAREYYLGEEEVSKYLGAAFHAFLLDIPGLDYGAIIPKGDYMTVCLLSSHQDLQPATLDAFLNHPSVKAVLPPDFPAEHFACWCGPRINAMGSRQPFGDRIVFIGDSGVSRLYKDGIGAAYRSAKAAARTALFEGVSARDFKRSYLPFCRTLENDNRIGRMLFLIIGRFRKIEFLRRALLRMADTEQHGTASAEEGISMLMWDMLTGGAPFKEVLRRGLQPIFVIRLLWNVILSLLFPNAALQTGEAAIERDEAQDVDGTQPMEEATRSNALGRVYEDGEVIFWKGDAGDCMFVIQEGQVEVVEELDGHEVRLAVSQAGDVIGEMAIFDRQARSATVRAIGRARVLTVDEKTFLRYVHQDPSLAYQLLKIMSNRVRRLNTEVTRLKVDERLADQRSKTILPAQRV
ncbi:MAG: cyclic nucleotide-binding domain-containing protein [Bacteroidota bacterium]